MEAGMRWTCSAAALSATTIRFTAQLRLAYSVAFRSRWRRLTW